MCPYKHLTLEEREDIMVLFICGESITKIAQTLGRSKSTISREVRRNTPGIKARRSDYRAWRAQDRYEKRRVACRRRIILEDEHTYELVARCFLQEQYSPEQIEGRLVHEYGSSPISDTTIYRAIHAGLFDGLLPNKRRATKKLRHKGKRRGTAGTKKRGTPFAIQREITDWPDEVTNRSRLGDWESDTVLGKRGGACLVTNVDRKSGYLVGGKANKKRSKDIERVMMSSFRGLPVHTITPDRGSEFASYTNVESKLDCEFYFALPHHPWERGTNENTNGLLREYFPKGHSLNGVSEQEVQAVYDKLNKRPRKRLGYLTPYEVFHSTVLHLV